jgi:hypothetical protein
MSQLRSRVTRLERRQAPDGNRVLAMSICDDGQRVERVIVTLDGQCREVPPDWLPPDYPFKVLLDVSLKDDF